LLPFVGVCVPVLRSPFFARLHLPQTLYHESMLCFYESCSLETLRNALHVLQEWKVIKLQKEKTSKSASAVKVSLLAPYNVRSLSRLFTFLFDCIVRAHIA
jgi:hypothetical protein